MLAEPVSLLTEVCHKVSIEPDLQPISGEIFHRASTNIQDGARLDVAMSGFWGGAGMRDPSVTRESFQSSCSFQQKQ